MLSWAATRRIYCVPGSPIRTCTATSGQTKASSTRKRTSHFENLRIWSARNKWKSELLIALSDALLQWEERRSADKVIELLLCVWGAYESASAKGVWCIPNVPAMIRLQKRFRAGECRDTSASIYDGFVDFVVYKQTAPKERLINRARLMLRHPLGPDLDPALDAYRDIADNPGHVCRGKHGRARVELREMALEVAALLGDAGRVQDASWFLRW